MFPNSKSWFRLTSRPVKSVKGNTFDWVAKPHGCQPSGRPIQHEPANEMMNAGNHVGIIGKSERRGRPWPRESGVVTWRDTVEISPIGFIRTTEREYLPLLDPYPARARP